MPPRTDLPEAAGSHRTHMLKFELDPTRETFDGRAEIDVTVRRPTSKYRPGGERAGHRQRHADPRLRCANWKPGGRREQRPAGGAEREVSEPLTPGRSRIRTSSIAARWTNAHKAFIASSTAPQAARRPASCWRPNSSRRTREPSSPPSMSRRSGRPSTSSSRLRLRLVGVEHAHCAADRSVRRKTRDRVRPQILNADRPGGPLLVAESDACWRARTVPSWRQTGTCRARRRGRVATGHESCPVTTAATTSAFRTRCPNSTQPGYLARAGGELWRTGRSILEQHMKTCRCTTPLTATATARQPGPSPSSPTGVGTSVSQILLPPRGGMTSGSTRRSRHLDAKQDPGALASRVEVPNACNALTC